MRPKARRLLWIAPLAILGVAAFILIGGEVVRLLWNWLLPGLFGWREITFWQAVGLLALCRILFGRLGLRGGPHYRGRRMAEHWAQMTPAEREQFRQRFRGRCGSVAPPDSSTTA